MEIIKRDILKRKDVDRIVKQRIKQVQKGKFPKDVMLTEIVKLFFQIPGIELTIHNKGGFFYSAIGCLEDLKRRILEINPNIRIKVNTLIKFKVEIARGLCSSIKVQYQFVQNDEIQQMDNKTFNNLVDAHDINLL